MPNSSLIALSDFRAVRFSADVGAHGWESANCWPSAPAAVVRATHPVDDHLFVGSALGTIHKLSLRTGKQLAQFPSTGSVVWGLAHAAGVLYVNAGSSLSAYQVAGGGAGLLWSHGMGDYSWGSPAVADGIVHAGSWDGKLHALRTDGSVAWISSEFPYFAAEPIVVGGVVYTGAFDRLVALDAATGVVLWTAGSPNGETILSPVAFGDGRIYAATGWGARLCAFDAATGAPLWVTAFGGHPTPPTFWNGRVFASAENGAGDGYLKAFDATDGHLIWTSSVPVSGSGDAVSRAIQEEGFETNHVFVASQNGYVYAFRRSDGAKVWQVGIGSSWPLDPTWTDAIGELPWKSGYYAAMDPLALILRGDVYVKIKLPYPPPLHKVMVRLRLAAPGFSGDERRRALEQLGVLEEVARSLRQAFSPRDPGQVVRTEESD